MLGRFVVRWLFLRCGLVDVVLLTGRACSCLDEGRVLVVGVVHVAEGHVVDEAVADVRAGPGLSCLGVRAYTKK